MNYRYYQDSLKRYLVIACDEERTQEDDSGEGGRHAGGKSWEYQYRMLSANRIPGLVCSSLRTINNRQFLYLDITGMQSLEDLFADRRLSGAFAKRILYSLTAAGESIARYLLDSRNLLTDPRFIYYSRQTDSCSFVYCPGTSTADYAALFHFMAERTDPADKQGTRVIYQLCELAEQPNFVPEKRLFDRLFTEDPGAGMQDSYRDGAEERREGNYGTFAAAGSEMYQGYRSRQPDGYWQEEEQRGGREAFRQDQMHALDENGKDDGKEEENADPEPEKTGEEMKRSIFRTLVAAFVLLAVAAGAEALHLRFRLNGAAAVAVRATAAAGAGGCVLLACYGMILVWKHRQLRKEQEEKDAAPEMERTTEYRKRGQDGRNVVSYSYGQTGGIR